MKKLALIMLAFVSMALVSCGGGGDEGVKPADPSIVYNTISENRRDHWVDLRDCLQVNKVAIRENGLYKVSVTVQLEMVKEPSEPIQWFYASAEVLDKNEAVICKNRYGESLDGVVHKGDIGSLTIDIETEVGLPASQVVEEAKYVRIIEVEGRNLKD